MPLIFIKVWVIIMAYVLNLHYHDLMTTVLYVHVERILCDRISSIKQRGKWLNFQYQDDCNIAIYVNLASIFRTSTYVQTLR